VKPKNVSPLSTLRKAKRFTTEYTESTEKIKLKVWITVHEYITKFYN